MLLSFSLSFLAYLDPGSGSMLLSAIIGIIATLYFIVKTFAYKVVYLPSFLWSRRRGIPGTRDVVIYSEGKRYWNVFAPVLRELDFMGIQCTYLSNEEAEQELAGGFQHVEFRCIGRGSKAFLVLGMLEAKICVATTPGLDVLQFRRSRGVRKYCHITHSAGGVAGYSTYGLDYYDMVLVGGDGDRKMIRELEAARGTSPKDICVVGCTYLDALRWKMAEEGRGEACGDAGRKTILISPTWGKHGMLAKAGEGLLSTLVRSDRYKLIVRPHPQSFESDMETLASLLQKYPEGEYMVWDREADGLEAMRKADIMVSDFSGIIFDFLFLFRRPVVAFMAGYDKRGKDAMDLRHDPWNIAALKRLGGAYREQDIPELPDRIDALLEGKEAWDDVVDELQSEMDKYPGESGERAADAIARSLAEVKRRENGVV